MTDLCAMLDEAAYALVPGPVASTALATLLLDDAEALGALISGERVAAVALAADVRLDGDTVSGRADHVLGAEPGALLLLPAGTSGCWSTVPRRA